MQRFTQCWGLSHKRVDQLPVRVGVCLHVGIKHACQTSSCSFGVSLRVVSAPEVFLGNLRHGQAWVGEWPQSLLQNPVVGMCLSVFAGCPKKVKTLLAQQALD